MLDRGVKSGLFVAFCSVSALVLVQWLRSGAIQQQIPHADATLWMVDGMPGVGAQTKRQVLQQVHDWQFDGLRRDTREAILTHFIGPD